MSRNKKFIIWLILEILLLISILVIGYKLFKNEKVILPQIQFNDLFVGRAFPTFVPDIQTLGILVEEDIDECWSDYDCWRTIQCESGWTHYYKNGKVIRGKAGEYGIAQFKVGTWNLFNQERGTNLDIMSREDQLDMIMWAFNKGEKYRRHWTCYIALDKHF